MGRFLSLVAFLFFSCPVFADSPTQGVCPSQDGAIYTVTGGPSPANGETFPDLASAEQAYESSYEASLTAGNNYYSNFSYAWSPNGDQFWQVAVSYTRYGDQDLTTPTYIVIQVACTPPVCNVPAGQSLGAIPVTYNSNGSIAPVGGGNQSACVDYCQSNSSLVLDMTLPQSGSSSGQVTGSMYEWVSSGQSCSTPSTSIPTPGAGLNGFNCIKLGNVEGCSGAPGTIGDAADFRKQDANTNTTDDDGPSATSSDSLNTDGCVTVTSGAMFCVSSAFQPDNGTLGDPATPTAVDTLDGAQCPGGQTCTFNYYTASQVNESTNYGSASNAAGTTGGTGVGTSSAGSGGGTGSSTGTCTGGTGCGDGTYTPPQLGDASSFGAATNDFLNRVQNAPVLSGISSLTIPGDGSCPTYQINAWFINGTIDAQCGIFESIRSNLTAFCYAVFLIVAIRILLSA